MEKGAIKKRILIFIMVLLFVPMIEGFFHFIKVSALEGAYEKEPKPSVSWLGFFKGKDQEHVEKYLNENFGFRNIFVRIYNQIAFSVFRKAKANGVTIGKENYLFEKNYIVSYFGGDFLGEANINETMLKVKSLSDSLKKNGTDLVLIFAAGKGFYYPEYFPDEDREVKRETNYQYFVSKSKELGIHYVDFNKYFVEQKPYAKYPLFPQYGIHWTKYGMAIVADSLIKYIERLKNLDVAGISWSKVDVSNIPRSTDYDIADGMNLLFRLKSTPLAYPEMVFESNQNKSRPRVLTISDSYYKEIFQSGILNNSFGRHELWYYNNDRFTTDKHEPDKIEKSNLKNKIEKFDVIFVMATTATLPKFGWNFFEEALSSYSMNNENANKEPVEKPSFDKEVETVVTIIRNDEKWLADVKNKAEQKNISLDSMIRLDAIYMVEQKGIKR